MLLRGRPTGQTVWNAHGAIIEGSGADAAVGVRGLVSHQGSIPVLGKPIPPGKFRISYKLASFVTVVSHGKTTTIKVRPGGQPQGWSK